MSHFIFAQPYWLLLLLLLVPMLWVYMRPKASLFFSLGRRLKISAHSPLLWLKHVGFLLRILAIGCFILAMARPQSGRTNTKQKNKGLDMMLVVDTSKSMSAMDFTLGGKRQDRLEVSKRVLAEFINKRTNDRIGLTIFGTHAFAYVPMTLDHDVLLRYLDESEIGMAGASTAIGDAVGVAVNRLKDLEAKSKIIILLTDGSNQYGKIEPLDAAKAASTMGIKIYTIGVGSNKPVPVPTQFGIQHHIFELDETLLKKMAAITKGRYFYATNTETLEKVYRTIDELEKTEIEVQVFHQYEEKFALFLWPGIAFLILEIMFSLSRWRRLL